MISRARSLDGLLLARLAERSELEAGAPQYLLDEIDRLLKLERQSSADRRKYLQTPSCAWSIICIYLFRKWALAPILRPDPSQRLGLSNTQHPA